MARRGRPELLVTFATCLLLLVATGPAGAVTAPVAPATPTAAPVHADGCFPPDGTDFVVGTEGPQIAFTLHLSLLPAVISAEEPTNVSTTNLSTANTTVAAGALGIEASATTGTDEIVSLRSGVLFTGVDNATEFLANPFAPFAFAFDYALTIPAFEGTMADPDYRESDVPVEGPVEEAACSQ